MREPPAFWQEEDALAARLLAPLGAVYGWATVRRIARAEPYRASVPVVCVGNASLGGVGKTPFALMLLERLTAMGRRPHALTRGYGGTERGPHRVGADDPPARVGDEALLLSAAAPVWISADRAAGARAAAADGADMVVMDDGFQNPGLAKDLSFLLADAEALFGNGHVFPAGPLREPPEAAAARADALVSVGGPPPDALKVLAGGKRLVEARLALDADALPDGPVHAFAGIGRPERFFSALEDADLTVAARRAFPDHHPYTEDDLAPLIGAASAAGRPLVTTAKDFVRVPPSQQAAITPLPARMVLPPGDEAWLHERLEAL